ncbi:DUF3488 and transglutaminase-like domain-containing protein [Thalassolituus sp.]|jgi:transglutaminase-like putative cysteine protease|uniref:transglutaminase family protein n=1 Tax=Thalassolituus sp. TaxID=2030822 RepID=UPI000BD25709|nr:MAG: transglutaminase [Oceanospirillales bacterium]PHQ85211.1 MAG: transglutaminase [Thalassobium sp.]
MKQAANAIPRISLLWLLAGFGSSLLLHTEHLPIWFLIPLTICVGWRALTHAGRLPYPNKLVKTLVVMLSGAVVVISFDRQLSLEGASAFLVMAAMLKLLEMKTQRDAYVVVFISYFLLVCGFLFNQSITAALIGISSVWIITSSMVALHMSTPAGNVGALPIARYSASVLAAALPFMLFAYLLFPRLGPLWSIGLQSKDAHTALSTEMAPGDIASLSQSDKLAFRVTFDDNRRPPQNELYWRALMLDFYDGNAWQPSKPVTTAKWFNPRDLDNRDGQGIGYDIIQEPTDQQYLFSLRGVQALEENTGVTNADFLLARKPLFQRLRYRAWSDPTASNQADGLTWLERKQYLQLPSQGNIKARQWANDLYSGAVTDWAFAQSILTYFRQNPFFYTLEPPLLKDNDIDEFLFSTQRGFCAHYASAMTFVARSVGIPARVVVGYQGGEWNAQENYLTVRQYDAHAWVELWIPTMGWMRFDPTAAVAPDRIEYGLERAVEKEGTFLREQIFSSHKMRGISWINSLRLKLDSANYYWQRWVLSYDKQRQGKLLKQWFDRGSYLDGLYMLAAVLGGLFLLSAIVLWWRDRPKQLPPLQRAWVALQNRAQRSGLEPLIGETGSSYLARLGLAWPELDQQSRDVASLMDAFLYGELSEKADKADYKMLVRRLGQLRRSLRPRTKTSATSNVHKGTV